ncbi:thioredoxin family protein [Neptuniibacter sp.]|uniref:thioredoxin family protein n=1 Tax=Neptuniibacter sp. TaxID=1962643 RepID=UPI0026233BC1|nr:thioredoxin family protein [Neptuniibacter sp.]MCP4595717.1 thioredoxin family protein [Neptuniibacter sp.]
MSEIFTEFADWIDVGLLGLSKETSPEINMSFGVMSTPAVVVNGQPVHSGRIPTQTEDKSWLDSLLPAYCC